MKLGGGRSKGASAEREVIKLLGPIVKEFGEGKLFRNLEQVRSGGHDIVGVDWIAIEVKRCETLAVEAWWKQCVEQSERQSLTVGHEVIPALIYRQSRKPWSVVMFGGISGRGKLIYPARVTISMWEFLEWFRRELSNDKERRLAKHSDIVAPSDV